MRKMGLILTDKEYEELQKALLVYSKYLSKSFEAWI
jgi:hypothetical protein